MRRVAVLLLSLLGSPIWAQEDDRDFLTAFLEDNLSGAGREVSITGFAGALSSRATIEMLTIADDDGIWLTINGATLDWSRSALLSGEVRVSELSADEIIMSRLPASDAEEDGLPAPEATAFALPELPVSVEIDRVAADRIELGPTILGQSFEGTLVAALSLSGGDGSAMLDLNRTDDGPSAEIALAASYSNTTRELVLSLDATEGQGGIVVNLLGVPGAPAAEFRLSGQGPLENHQAEIGLATDGQDRLTGAVILGQEVDGGYRLQADVSGNIAPILAPDHVDFFGTDVGLSLDARHSVDGQTTLDRLSVTARSLNLQGRGVIASDGLPETLDLTGTLADPGGEPLLLPFGNDPTRINRAEFRISGGLSTGNRWTADVGLDGLTSATLDVERLSLSGTGLIARQEGRRSIDGSLEFLADAMRFPDPAIAAALGPDLGGALQFKWTEGSGYLDFPNIDLQGVGLAASGALKIQGPDTQFLASGKIDLEAQDLSRFSILAGRPLGGSGSVSVEGSAGLLSGSLDGTALVTANGLTVGIAEVDSLLRGGSLARLSVLRDGTGTTLRAFDVTAGTLSAQASGKLASEGSNLSAEISLPDLSALGGRYGGSVTLAASLEGTFDNGTVRVDGTGTALRIGEQTADRVLAGATALSAVLRLRDGAVDIEKASVVNPQLKLALSGVRAGSVLDLKINARLANLGLILPDLEGPLVLTGSASQTSAGYTVDSAFQGPAGINGNIRGSVAAGLARADLTLDGIARANLANIFISPRSLDGQIRYDLALKGPLRPASLTGRITLSNGRFSDPSLGASLEGIEAVAQLLGGQARVSATSRLSTGGLIRVDGPVGLDPPYQSRLDVTLDRLRLVDPDLYEATLGGQLRIEGPLAGGALIAGTVTLAEAELRVSDTGFASASSLLDLSHVNEPSDVRLTRLRAGLIETDGNRSSASAARQPFRLDLTVSAPSRIFVRGRGIDAELGGQIRLAGTSAAVVPSGQFDLIRGRLDILGQRLVLTEAQLQLEGSLVPIVRVVAENRRGDVTSRVTVDGPADDPTVTFSSVPELPQEEVLAQLLFGRDLGRLSALQAAQLANAVAVLAGQGGEGIITRLRNNFGLDDLDFTTAEDGSTALTAGRYLSENLYTEIEIEQEGRTSVTLNFDLTDGVTARGRLETDGDSGIGIFVERDY